MNLRNVHEVKEKILKSENTVRKPPALAYLKFGPFITPMGTACPTKKRTRAEN